MDFEDYRSPEDLLADFSARRSGLIKALTTDAEELYRQCSPRRENLCLYGLRNGDWEVTLPAERVPADIPEPTLGINFARDAMLQQDWLYLVAVHSDSWLLAVTFYFGARFRLNRCGRQYLFNMINNLPTVAEVVLESRRERSTVTDGSSTKSKSSSNEINMKTETKDEDVELGEEDVDEHDDTMCGACGKNDDIDEFWIYCDVCERWFHGKCVKMTPAKAKNIEKYKCPSCVVNKRVRP